MRLLLALVAAFALVACGSGPSTTATDAAPDLTTDVAAVDAPPPDSHGPVGCTPGRVEACPCPGMPTGGSQTCVANGTFGPCVCPDAGSVGAAPEAAVDATSDRGAEDVTADTGTDGPSPDRMLVPCSMGSPCADRCVDLESDLANCGACGNVCTGEQLCGRGGCITPTCSTGFVACHRACCDARVNRVCCGGCDSVCPLAPAHSGRSACRAGTCTLTCVDLFADCDGMVANGCEADVSADRLNCGACGRACAGRCLRGTCE